MKNVQKSKWPTFCQTFVKWLAKKVLHEDIDRTRSSSVALQLRLNTLWGAGVRAWHEYGHVTGPGDVSVPRTEVEWTDLYDALNSVKTVDPVVKQTTGISTTKE